MASNYPETYPCWIGNITTAYSIDDLEEYFKTEGEKIGKVSSVKVTFAKAHNTNQCYINYIDQSDAEKAANAFNGKLLDNIKLNARFRLSTKKPAPACGTGASLPSIIDTNSQNKSIEINQVESMILDKYLSPLLQKLQLSELGSRPSKSQQQKESLIGIQHPKINPKQSASYANQKYEDDEDEDDYSSDSSSTASITNASTKSKNADDQLSETVTIRNAEFLKKSIDNRVKNLKRKFPSVNVDIELDKIKTRSNLLAHVKAINKNDFDNVLCEIKSWKVDKRKINYKNNEMKAIPSFKEKILRLVNGIDELFVKVNEKKELIDIFALNRINALTAYTKIKEFIKKNIKKDAEIRINDDEEFEFIFHLFKKDKKKFELNFNLQNIKIEFKKEKGLIILSGTGDQIDKIDLNKISQVYSKSLNLNLSKNTLSYVRVKLRRAKKSIETKSMVFKFDDQLKNVKIIGFDEDSIDQQIKELEEFAKNARSEFINVNGKDKTKAKEIVDEYKKRKSNSFNNEDDDDGDDTEVNYVEDKSCIYINGTDENEVNHIKTYLEDKLKGSQENTKAIKVKNYLLYSRLIKDNPFDQFKIKYQKAKIFYKFNKERVIRITGENNIVSLIENEINDQISKISDNINSKLMDLNPSQFNYLSTHKEEIRELERSNNCSISKSKFEKYASVSLNNGVTIILCTGNYLDVYSDAYVSPVNVDLKSNDGLAGAIIKAAGNEVKSICEDHVKLNGPLREGDAFVSSSGCLGIKYNSIILHAVGPQWKGGRWNEAINLKKVVENCLTMASDKRCKSIVIPPISTGIFNYPVDDACKVIADTVIDYFSKYGNNTLKEIIFIDNDETKVEAWERVLKQSCIAKGKTIASTSKSECGYSWYWKDDQGNWKAYSKDYNEYIQTKFVNREFIFDMNINGENYRLCLNQKPFYQINIVTNYRHEVDNNILNVQNSQWLWKDDKITKSPYSINHSSLIEKGFMKRNEFMELEIKRHVDDEDCNYKRSFKNRNYKVINHFRKYDPNSEEDQLNPKKTYERLIYRKNITACAFIDTSDLDNKNIKRSNIVFINAFSNNLNSVVYGINKIIENGIKKESLPLVDLSLEQIRSLEQDNNVTIKTDNNKMIVSGMNDDVDKIKSFVLDFIVKNANKIKYPNEWTHSLNNIETVKLDQNSREFETIYNKIKETVVDFEISKIERIQNKHLWKVYQRQIDFFKDKGVPINETSLFHGTRSYTTRTYI